MTATPVHDRTKAILLLAGSLYDLLAMPETSTGNLVRRSSTKSSRNTKTRVDGTHQREGSVNFTGLSQADRDELFALLQAARMFCLDALSDSHRIQESREYKHAWNARRMAIEEWLAYAQADVHAASDGRYLDPAMSERIRERAAEVIAAYEKRHPPAEPEPSTRGKSWGPRWLGGGRT